MAAYWEARQVRTKKDELANSLVRMPEIRDKLLSGKLAPEEVIRHDLLCLSKRRPPRSCDPPSPQGQPCEELCPKCHQGPILYNWYTKTDTMFIHYFCTKCKTAWVDFVNLNILTYTLD